MGLGSFIPNSCRFSDSPCYQGSNKKIYTIFWPRSSNTEVVNKFSMTVIVIIVVAVVVSIIITIM